jgi:hypothetical protein
VQIELVPAINLLLTSPERQIQVQKWKVVSGKWPHCSLPTTNC